MSKPSNATANSHSVNKLNNKEHKDVSNNGKDSALRHEAHLTQEEDRPKSPWCAECFKRKKTKNSELNDTKCSLFKRLCCKKKKKIDGKDIKQTEPAKIQSKLQEERSKKKKKKRDRTSPSSDPSMTSKLPEIKEEKQPTTLQVESYEKQPSSIKIEESRSSRSYEVLSKDNGVIDKDSKIIDKDSKVISSDKKTITDVTKKEEKEIKPEKSQTYKESISEKKSSKELEKLYEKDFTRTCCYLCAKHTVAIAAIISHKVNMSDKSIQVSYTFAVDKAVSPKETKSCKTKKCKPKSKDVGVMCPSMKKKTKSSKPKRSKPKTKRRKFNIFSKFRRTKCPVKRHVGCVTEENRPITSNAPTRKVHCCKHVL